MTWRAQADPSPTMVHVEAPRADELPVGVPAPARAQSPGDRGPGGRFAPANALAAEGGRAKRGQAHLVARLGLAALPEANDFAPYRRSATTYRRVQCAELARTVGGGVCGPGPSSIVASAALALAWSRYLSDRAAATGDTELAMRSARLGETSRQHLLAAHELAAREAAAREANPAPDAPMPWGWTRDAQGRPVVDRGPAPTTVTAPPGAATKGPTTP